MASVCDFTRRDGFLPEGGFPVDGFDEGKRPLAYCDARNPGRHDIVRFLYSPSTRNPLPGVHAGAPSSPA